MSEYLQADRWLRIETPLGADVLLVSRMEGREAVSDLFEYELDLLSDKDDIDPVAIIGKPVKLIVGLVDGSERAIHGHVESFSALGRGDRLSMYTCRVVPWLWFLTNNRECRIFQEMSVVEIAEKIFGERGFSDYETGEIKGSHPKRDFVVQYRESDFDFVSRLLEEEGIWYFFRQEDDRHTLVLGDSNNGFEDCRENEIHFPSRDSVNTLRDDLYSWQHRYRFRPGTCTYRDYNFKTPRDDLEATENTTVDYSEVDKYEVYDYPGRYLDKGEGKNLVKLRMEEKEVDHDFATGSGKCRTFFAGGRFTMAEHQLPGEVGKTWIITEIRHTFEMGGSYVTGAEAHEVDYRNHFTCVPEDSAYRPPHKTPKPFIRGSQTAEVTGPAGEEIYTDRYGRIKVQFFWDREGRKDEESSCWMRVVWPTAGAGWGTVAIPRIGHEVMVQFLEGDPDRPVVVGSLYNELNMPPVTKAGRKERSSSSLEDNRMILTIRTNSLQETGGHNEISMDDTSGEESFYIRAQWDQFHEVGNDREDKVGHDEKIEIGNDRTESVGNDESIEIGNNRTEQVGTDETVTIGSNRTHSVGADDSLDVGANQTLTVGGDRQISVGVNQTLTVGASLDESVGANLNQSVGANRSATITGNETVSANGNVSVSATMITLEAKATLSLKCGGSQIVITPASIMIQSPMLKLN